MYSKSEQLYHYTVFKSINKPKEHQIPKRTAN